MYTKKIKHIFVKVYKCKLAGLYILNNTSEHESFLLNWWKTILIKVSFEN